MTAAAKSGSRGRAAGPLAALALTAAMAGLAAAATRRVLVVGTSMAPALAPGDRLLVARLPARWPLRPGDLVALADPRPPPGAPPLLLVKRVVSTGPWGVEVAGDNGAASTDSRVFGPVPRRSVIGRPVYRYGPPGRTGRLGRPGPARAGVR
jgi:signal peptidase I